MIERNVGSAALVGGNAKLGGSAWGAEKTDGNVLFDGVVTLETMGEEPDTYLGGLIELTGTFEDYKKTIVIFDGVSCAGLSFGGAADVYAGSAYAMQIAPDENGYLVMPDSEFTTAGEHTIKLIQMDDAYTVIYDGEISVTGGEGEITPLSPLVDGHAASVVTDGYIDGTGEWDDWTTESAVSEGRISFQHPSPAGHTLDFVFSPIEDTTKLAVTTGISQDITFTARLIQFDTPVYPSEE